MTNTAASIAGSLLDNDGISLANVYSSVSNSTRTHKSFDFSNVGLNNYGSRSLRQFHQTRLYIQDFSEMYTHGQQLNDSTYLISANLPDNVEYQFGSEWKAPFADLFNNAMANVIMQAGSNIMSNNFGGKFSNFAENTKSGINRAAMLKVWGGTDALKLTLKIPVVDDRLSAASSTNVTTNFTEALEFLGCLCLPRNSGKIGFYQPPPSPLEATIKYTGLEKGDNKSFSFGSSSKARILLQLGGMLMVDKCVLERVSVSYPNTKSMILQNMDGVAYLSPLLANVTITLSTVEALTAETFSKMLWLSTQPDQGTGTYDASSVTNLLKKGVDFGKGLFGGGK